jgi:hypothetical protein
MFVLPVAMFRVMRRNLSKEHQQHHIRDYVREGAIGLNGQHVDAFADNIAH